MKRVSSTIFILVLLFGLTTLLPSAGYSWQHHHGHYRGHGYYNGWVPAAIIAGTLLTGVIIAGAISQSTRPVYQQPGPYVYPGPTTYYPPLNQPYAAPDPAFIAKYDKKGPTEDCIIVPGQYVGNTWVPAHCAPVP